MDTLPEALSRAIGRHGARITFRHRLASVEFSGEGGPISLSFDTQDGRISLSAGRVVLAMPAGAVARVEGLAERPEIHALLSALAPQDAVATALVFKKPWWREIGIHGGASTTDLPVRHLRHHGGEQWRGSRRRSADQLLGRPERPVLARSLEFGAPATGWISADHPVACELHSQAQMMFGRKMPMALPCTGRRVHPALGRESAAGAAFHMWSKGSSPADVMRSALCPVPAQKLHICGEAWSPRQGWIEGALESVDMMLEREIPHDRLPLPTNQ